MTDLNPARIEALHPGAILSFRVPKAEDGKPGNTRPCLVIASRGNDELTRLAQAYGTSAGTPANRGLDITLDEEDEWWAAGLRRPSRFVLARRINAGPDDPRLVFCRAGIAVLAQLAPERRAELARLAQRLGDDVGQDCLCGRPPQRKPFRRNMSPTPSFVVEQVTRRRPHTQRSA